MYKKLLFLTLWACSSKTLYLPPETAQTVVIGTWPGGLFAGFLVVLNHLGWCENHQKTPFVLWYKGSPYHTETAQTPVGLANNAWEYYFEQVSDAQPQGNHYISWEYSLGDPNFHYNATDPESRHKAYSLIKKYIRVQPHIATKVDNIYCRYIQRKKTIGIHLRGTDKKSEEAPITAYQAVQAALPYADSSTQFLVASDEQSLLDEMVILLADYDVLYYPCQRSIDGKPLHFQPELAAKNGEDVLIEVLLLSKCNMLVHSRSNVSTAALYFNPHLEHITFNK